MMICPCSDTSFGRDIMSCNIDVYAVEDYKEIPYNLLRQLAILRWWIDDGTPWEDGIEEELKKDIDFMLTWKSNYDHVTFYVLAKTENDKIVGFAQFFQNKNNDSVWTYGDLVINENYTRKGIATKLIECGLHELEKKNAKTLLTFIDKDNEASVKLHEKLYFIQSTNQNTDNMYAGEGRIMYERVV